MLKLCMRKRQSSQRQVRGLEQMAWLLLSQQAGAECCCATSLTSCR